MGSDGLFFIVGMKIMNFPVNLDLDRLVIGSFL